MARRETGKNEDGSTCWHFFPTDEDIAAGRIHPFKTGPVQGIVSIGNGVEYDVGDDWIYVHEDHAIPLLYHVHKMHNRLGTDGVPDLGETTLDDYRTAFLASQETVDPEITTAEQ